MAQITINIPNGILGDILDAIAFDTGYETDPPRPETKGQWARLWLKRELREKLIKYKNSQATTTGRPAVLQAIEQAKTDADTLNIT